MGAEYIDIFAAVFIAFKACNHDVHVYANVLTYDIITVNKILVLYEERYQKACKAWVNSPHV